MSKNRLTNTTNIDIQAVSIFIYTALAILIPGQKQKDLEKQTSYKSRTAFRRLLKLRNYSSEPATFLPLSMRRVPSRIDKSAPKASAWGEFWRVDAVFTAAAANPDAVKSPTS